MVTSTAQRARSGTVEPMHAPNDCVCPPDGVAWQVNDDPSVLVGGVCALLMQALHPLVIAAVAQHSSYQDDPWGRLQRTARFVHTVTYAPRAEAETAIAHLNMVHGHVRGVDPVTGRAYCANDADLLAWVHVTEVWGFLSAYRRYGPGLDDVAADRYVAEMAEIAVLLGVADADVPRNVAELDSQLLGRVEGLAVTAPARDAQRFLLAPPVGKRLRALYVPVALGAVALLPQPMRYLWGMRYPEVATPAVRAAVRGWCKAASPFLGRTDIRYP